jgi:thiol:disulfide interchange protein DsbD
MRKLVLFISLILFISHLSAQIYDPVTWDFSYEKKNDKQYELIFTATIEKNSHIYAMDILAGGPIPTSFKFDSVPEYKLIGNTFEVTKPVETFDDAFGFKIKTLSNTAEFRQKIAALEPFFTVNGSVNFMACNNATCSPPKDVEF